MYFTCKKCCTILKEEKPCPVCGKKDDLREIEITVQGMNKKV